MDPDCFAMSSYQFVNSLASCYPQQMNAQQGHPSGTSNTPNSNGPAGASSGGSGNSGAATPGNEYFPAAAAYAPNLYPNTPQTHYVNQAAYSLGASAGGSGGSSQTNVPEMVDYTQLQPQRLLMQQQQQHNAHASAAVQHAAAQQQQQQQQQLSQQLPQTQQQQQSSISCKYANDPSTPTGNNNTSSNNNNNPALASPQDLSTRDISPKLSPSSVVESVARSLNKGVMGVTLNNNHTSNVNVPMHSPGEGDSDSESDSGNEAGSSQNSGGKKNPPHIYPWMKRVHIGQSK